MRRSALALAALIVLARTALAAFYIRRILPEHQALLTHAMSGAAGLVDVPLQDLGL